MHPSPRMSPNAQPDRELLGAAERVWAQAHHAWPGFSVEVLPEIDSTNSELMRRARAQQLAPTLLVAQQQSAGRGRQGRPWLSSPGAALLFSLGWPLAPREWSGLSLAVGVAVAESLHADIRLKWPNDLWLQGRKLGGILVETASAGALRYAVVGVGVNIMLPVSDTNLATPAAALREVSPAATPASALQAVAQPLIDALQLFEAQGFAAFAKRFAARDALLGREVHTSEGQRGLCQGVNEQGALLVHTAQGARALVSGELSVRPVDMNLPANP
jgi:BirA family transcriptional regulator, biotin operon repressor / biotin---[acetyl-CoA-carboxylase] ligase